MAARSRKSVLPSGGSAFILNSHEDTPMPNAFVYRRDEWKFSLALSIVLVLLGLGSPILGPILLAPQDDIMNKEIKPSSFGDDLYASGFIIVVFYMLGAFALTSTTYLEFEKRCRRKVRNLKQEMEDPFLRRGWERQAMMIVGEAECEAQLKTWKNTVDNVNVKDIAMRMHRHAMKKLRRGLVRIFAVMSSLFLLDCCLLGVIPFRTDIPILLTAPLTFTITYLGSYLNPKVETKSMSQDEEILDSGILMTQPLLQTEAEGKRILLSRLV